jgi:hypothetical protein
MADDSSRCLARPYLSPKDEVRREVVALEW